MYDLTGNCYYQRIFLIFKYLYQPISLEITKVRYANVLRIIVDDDISFWSAIRWKFSKPCSNFINSLGRLWRRFNIGLKKRAIFVSSQVPSHLNHAQFLTPTVQGYWLAVLRSFFANRHEEKVYDHSSSVLHLGISYPKFSYLSKNGGQYSCVQYLMCNILVDNIWNI